MNIPRSLLPSSAKPGDVFTLTLEHDPDATRQLADQTRRVQDKLSQGDPGGDIQVVMTNRSLRLVALLLLGLFFTAAPPASRAQWPWSRSGGRSVVVQVLDVGQGDSILLRSPEGKMALIDAGPSRDGALNALRRGASSGSTWWPSAIITATITAGWRKSSAR